MSLPSGKFWSCCLSFHILPFKVERGCPFTFDSLWLLYCIDWDSLHDQLRAVPGKDILKLGVSPACIEFCQWVLAGIIVYISRYLYQVKPHPSLWFSAAIADRNHSFCLNQFNKSAYKMKLRQVIVAKGFLKLPNLLLVNLADMNFGKLKMLFLAKVNLAVCPLFIDPEVLPSTSDKIEIVSWKLF